MNLSPLLLAVYCCALSLASDVPQSGVVFANPGSAMETGKWNWTDCGDSSHAIRVKSIKISPDPPETGKNLTVIAQCDVREDITEGAYAIVVVKSGRIKLLQKEYDICEEAINANSTIQCPVMEGQYEIEYTALLPKAIPSLKYDVLVRGYTALDARMVCLDIIVDFSAY